jgi:predicted enzyme related to lactoylglutathione lyase
MENRKRPTLGNGKICYLEIPSLDIHQSAKFYRETFDWNIREDNAGNLSFDDTVGEVSGMWVMGRKATTEPGILISIMVDSIETTVNAIVANGGKIVQPVGTDASVMTALFTDPSGNVFCLYQDQS